MLVTMKTLDVYLSQYGESHQNETNLILHKICVPVIMWSLLGFLHTFAIAGFFHLSYVLVFVSLTFYALLRRPSVFVIMLIVTALMMFSFSFVPHLREVSLIAFVLAWVGQFYGHHIEGKRPSFLKDLLFLLIGPIWVFKQLQR